MEGKVSKIELMAHDLYDQLRKIGKYPRFQAVRSYQDDFIFINSHNDDNETYIKRIIETVQDWPDEIYFYEPGRPVDSHYALENYRNVMVRHSSFYEEPDLNMRLVIVGRPRVIKGYGLNVAKILQPAYAA
jgi:hypothetical protein